MTNNLDEARGFARSLESYVGGLWHLGDTFQANMIKKASEVINSLLDEIETTKENGKGKETFPPAPPYREKGRARENSSNNSARVYA